MLVFQQTKGLLSGNVGNPAGARLTVAGTSTDLTTQRDRDLSVKLIASNCKLPTLASLE